MRSSYSDQIVKIVMAERVDFVFYFLLFSKGCSKPLEDLSMESCDPAFSETSHFPVSLFTCTSSLPLTVTGYNTTTSLASNASPTTNTIVKYYNSYESGWTTLPYKSITASPASRTTTSIESMVTGLNYQELNGSLPSEYLRDPIPQDESEIIPGTEF